VQLHGGRTAWSRFTAVARGLPYEVKLDVEHRDGRYEVAAIRVARKPDGPEVTGEAIRAVPVRHIMNLGALKAAKELFSRYQREDLFKRVNDEALGLVADLYRWATMVGDPPTQTVAVHLFHGVRPTAARWVMRARQRGFLGPAEPGRAGERPAKRKGGKS
jgi:hypothetical protein